MQSHIHLIDQGLAAILAMFVIVVCLVTRQLAESSGAGNLMCNCNFQSRRYRCGHGNVDTNDSCSHATPHVSVETEVTS